MQRHLCRDTKLQNFQYKIPNRFFSCNYTLYVWYNDSSSNCDYCACNKDTLEHYFFECNDVALFWQTFSKWWKNIFEFIFNFTTLDILFGIKNESNDICINILNYCILLGKLHIFLEKEGVFL